MRAYQPRMFSHLAGIAGLSEDLISSHLAIYRAHVDNVNRMGSRLESMRREGGCDAPDYADLNRRYGWEFNGMWLHELYFENVTRDYQSLDIRTKLHRDLRDEFGSMATWEAEFRCTGSIPGVGWAVLYHDPVAGRLRNAWVSDQDEGNFAGCSPLLVMDVFDHAYLRDYGPARSPYIEAFLKIINWPVVAGRYAH